MKNQLPFFVYGTLIPGQPNDHYWRNAIVRSEPAVFANGNLYAFPSFPMLIEATGGEGMAVQGMLVEVEPRLYSAVLADIDALENYDPEDAENSPYRRVQRGVQTAAGHTVDAWVYLGHRRYTPTEEALISSGSWIEYCAQADRQNEMSRWWETNGLSLLFGRETARKSEP